MADRIARKLGLTKAHAFTSKQYALFISAKGADGDKTAAALVDASVRIFTNTTGRPLYANVDSKVTPTVLSSYGLFVNPAGMLMSLANTGAPTRKVNAVLAPGGKGGRSAIVGMSMAPSIWIVNFVAVYTLNPKLAAFMPARWTPIPADVVQAIKASPTGQVPYSEYESSFPG